jgi:hypothetical protein
MELAHHLGRLDIHRVLVAERPLLHAENEAELLYKLGQLAKVKPD